MTPSGPTIALRIEEVRTRFENAWKVGPPPRVEDYLDGWQDEERAALLRELVRLDLDYRREAGEAITLADYERRFPGLTPDTATRSFGPSSNDATIPPPAGIADAVTLDGNPTPAAAAPGLLPPGYELLGELGRGGMGVVYKARHVALNRPCALKMILSGAHSSSAEVERFKTEAQAIARLQHPSIVQVFEIGEHDGRPFMALEFCPGGSLDAKLARHPLPPREAADLVRALAEAMQSAHSANVIHRDLKPANVLLTERGEPKVTDFGLAKKLDEQGATRTGSVMGTPSYMPPEQAEGKKDVGPAADVYALGAILYEALTGRPPFRAATALDTLLQVLTDEPVPVQQLNPSVPRDLETICLKCLQKDAKKRYTSAQKLADDLGRFLADEPIQARPVGSLERGWRWVRRNPVVSGLAAAVLLVLTIGVVASWGLTAWALNEKGNAQYEAGEAQAARDLARAEATAARTAEEKARALAKTEAEAKTLAQSETKRAEDQKKRAQEEADRADAEKREAVNQLDRAERLAYAGKLSLAQSAFAEGNGVLALRHQEDCQWNLRGWEHRHLWTRFNSKQTLLGHTQPVTSVSWSPDGKRILTGSGDPRNPGEPGEAKVWDAEKGQEVLALKGHTGGVSSVSWSPDGKRILTGSKDRWDRTAKVWDAEKGQEVLALKGHTGGVTSVAWSPDGKRIVTGSGDTTAKVWDAEKGTEVLALKGHTLTVSSVAWSPDGKRILTGSEDRTAKVWDAEKGQEVLALKGHTGGVTSVAWSPDGKRILTGSGDTTAKVWDAEKGTEVLALKGHTLTVSSVSWSPDGKRILTGSGDPVSLGKPGEAKVWDAETGQEVLALKGHTDGVTSVSWSPDGKRIVTGSGDTTAKVWDAEKGTELLALKGHPHWVHSAAFSPDGKRILTGGGGYDNQWRPIPGEAKVWDAEKGTELLTLQGSVTSVRFSPDEKRIVAGSFDGTAKVWIGDKGTELLALKGHAVEVNSVCFSPDGKRAFAWDLDGKVLAWDAATGQPADAADPPARPAPGPARSSDGRFAAKPDGITVTLVDLLPPAPAGSPWPLPAPGERLRYHIEQAALAESQNQTFGTGFHREWVRLIRMEGRKELETRLAEKPTDPAVANALAYLLLESREPVEWTVLEPVATKSASGATLTRQADGSILAGGINPPTDVYTVEVDNTLKGVTALRLEALPDPSLPHGGPGRAPNNGNFCLSEIALLAQGVPVPLVAAAGDRRPVADDITERHGPHGAIDGDPFTFWDVAHRRGVASAAVFQAGKPCDAGRLVVRLECRSQHPGQTLGRFRLSATTRPNAVRDEALSDLARTASPWARLGIAYLLEDRPDLALGAFEKAVAASGSPQERVLLASTREQLGRPVAAAEAAEIGLALARLPAGGVHRFVFLRGLDVLSRGIAREPTAGLFLARSRLHARAGSVAVSNADSARAMDLDPARPLGRQDAVAHLWAARYWMAAYDPGRAAANALAAALLDPHLAKTPLAGHVFPTELGLWKVDGADVVADARVAGHLLRFGDPTWADFDIELEASRLGGDGDMVVVFRAADGGKYAQANVKGGPFQCAVNVLAGGKWTQLAARPGPIANNRWYKVMVSVRGDRAVVHLDGERVLETAGIGIGQGQVGLRSWGPARFRNLKVTAPDGTVLLDGPPRIHAPPTGETWPPLP